MVPYPTCRPRRGRSGSGCSRRRTALRDSPKILLATRASQSTGRLIGARFQSAKRRPLWQLMPSMPERSRRPPRPGKTCPFRSIRSNFSVFDELPSSVGSPLSNVGVIPEDKLSDRTRQNPHDADGDLNGVAAIASGEMKEPMMSDARRVRSLTRYSKRLSDTLLATFVD